MRLLHGELGAVASQLRGFHGAPSGGKWRPALNAFCCELGMKVCVDLAGVSRSQIEIFAEPTRLTVRGFRAPPEPPSPEITVQIFAMEIDYGAFERVVDLPIRVKVEEIAADQHNGFLWISLPAVHPRPLRGGNPEEEEES